MASDASEHVGEPGQWIDVIELCRHDQRSHGRGPVGAGSDPAKSDDLRYVSDKGPWPGRFGLIADCAQASDGLRARVPVAMRV